MDPLSAITFSPATLQSPCGNASSQALPGVGGLLRFHRSQAPTPPRKTLVPPHTQTRCSAGATPFPVFRRPTARSRGPVNDQDRSPDLSEGSLTKRGAFATCHPWNVGVAALDGDDLTTTAFAPPMPPQARRRPVSMSTFETLR